MPGVVHPRTVGSEELSEWRKRAWQRTRGNPMRYGVSQGQSMAAPLVEANEDGNSADLGVEPAGPKRDGRQLADIMERYRQDMLVRLQRLNPEAKLEMVRMLRRSNPALLAQYPDDAEAVKHLNDLIRQDAEATSKRALIRDARDATLIHGGSYGNAG